MLLTLLSLLNSILMAESRIIGIRVPDDIYDAIEDCIRATGRRKSEVVLALLKKGLGMTGKDVDAVNATVNDGQLAKK